MIIIKDNLGITLIGNEEYATQSYFFSISPTFIPNKESLYQRKCTLESQPTKYTKYVIIIPWRWLIKQLQTRQTFTAS